MSLWKVISTDPGMKDPHRKGMSASDLNGKEEDHRETGVVVLEGTQGVPAMASGPSLPFKRFSSVARR